MKYSRARVETSRSIRAIPFLSSRWKQFAKELERAADEMAQIETELKRIERSRPTQSRVRELRRESRKRELMAGASLSDLRHTLAGHPAR